MSAAGDIAAEIQQREGWTVATLVDVLLDYIDSQARWVTFRDYLDERSALGHGAPAHVTTAVLTASEYIHRAAEDMVQMQAALDAAFGFRPDKGAMLAAAMPAFIVIEHNKEV